MQYLNATVGSKKWIFRDARTPKRACALYATIACRTSGENNFRSSPYARCARSCQRVLANQLKIHRGNDTETTGYEIILGISFDVFPGLRADPSSSPYCSPGSSDTREIERFAGINRISRVPFNLTKKNKNEASSGENTVSITRRFSSFR